MLSFLIVNRNGGEVFKRGVASMIKNAQVAGIDDYEIVVVDNASTDDTSWLEKIPHVLLQRNKINEFFSVPTNDTVRLSKGDIILILNNDIVLDDTCVKKLLDALKKNNADAAVPLLRYPNGKVQQSITGIPTWKDIFYSALGLHIFAPHLDKWRLRNYDYSKEHVVTDQPMFSALMMKRSAWDTVGGLDPKLPLLWNDVDWFYRFHTKKLKCMFTPFAKAKHVHGMSVNKLVWRKLYLLSEGCYIFLTKHAKKKSILFNVWIFLLCTVTFFERIPVEFFMRLQRSK